MCLIIFKQMPDFVNFTFFGGGVFLYFFKYHWALLWHMVKLLGVNLILSRLVLGVVRVNPEQPEV